jgi:hypothetical protein
MTDAAGDQFTEVQHFTASDRTELSVWTAVVGAGAGTKPAITVTTTSAADIGVSASEYSGLATTNPVDKVAQATGSTTSARSVSSGSTPATTGDNELAVGFYADSGFGNLATADPGYTARTSLGPNAYMDLLTEDAVVSASATPAASMQTGANTVWLASTIVFRSS